MHVLMCRNGWRARLSVEGGPYGLCIYGCVGMRGEHGITVEGGPYGLCMYGCVGMGGEHGISVEGGPYGLCIYGCVGMGGEHGISVEGGPYGLCMYGCVGMGGEHGISVEGGPYGLCMYGCVGMGGENCMSVLYSYCVNIGIFFMQIFAKWMSLHLLCLFYTANLCLNANLCLIPKIAPLYKKNRDPTCLASTPASTTVRRAKTRPGGESRP